MSDFNWCHGPECHTYTTQSRVRGSGRDKVLRTRKVKIHYHSSNNNDLYTWYNFFCDNRCLMDYLRKHMQSVLAHEPRTKPLELPIKVEKEKYESYRYDWNSDENGATRRVPYMATRTTIKSVDNDNG